jgi:hypothetical protein
MMTASTRCYRAKKEFRALLDNSSPLRKMGHVQSAMKRLQRGTR